MAQNLIKIIPVIFVFFINIIAVYGYEELYIKAKSGIIVDDKTGKVLWSKRPDKKRYPASTLKIMTGHLMIKHVNMHKMITAPEDVRTIGEKSLYLQPGEQMRAREFLYAVLVCSANDAAHTVAKHISGSIPRFAALMNKEARRIGCTNTHFTNPHGLNDKNCTTTARDLALIAREAMKNRLFRDVVNTSFYKLDRPSGKGRLNFRSRNKFIRKDKEAIGIKTGYTRPAGPCFVGCKEKKGIRLINVILKGKNTVWDDNKAMFDWAFRNHRWFRVGKKGKKISEAELKSGMNPRVNYALSKDVYCVFRKGEKCTAKVRYELFEDLEAPIKKGQKIGYAKFKDASGFRQKIPLLALESVSRDRLSAKLLLGDKRVVSGFMFALVIGSCALLFYKS